MEDDEKTQLREMFGESSEEEDDVVSPFDDNFTTTTWESIQEIKGLWLLRHFLSSQHQSSLLSSIQNEGWFVDASKNQAMRFGDLPPWAVKLTESIREIVSMSCDMFCASGSVNGEEYLLPPDILWREPLFDQMIVNVYEPGDLCTCRPHALPRRDCHCLFGVILRDALYTS